MPTKAEEKKERRLAQEKHAILKKSKRICKRLQKERKQNKKADNTEYLEPEVSREESDPEGNIDLPQSSCTEPGTSHAVGPQTSRPKDSFKESRKTGSVRTPPKEKLAIKPPDPKISKKITKEKEIGSNIDKTGQDCSQSNPLCYSEDQRLHKDEQAKTQVKAENKEKRQVKVETGTLKPVESEFLATNKSKHIPSKEPKEKTEDLTKKRDILQQKKEKFETDVKSLDEQEKKLLTSPEEKEFTANGNIKILATDESVKNSSGSGFSYCFYKTDQRIIRIGDENINIYIFVKEGNQVVCNSRRLSAVDLIQNVETCTDIRESHATATLGEGNITSDTYDITTSDTKCDSRNARKLSRSFQTVDNQASGIPDAGNVDSEQDIETETETDTERITGDIRTASMEICPTREKSLEEKIRKVCDEYLMNLNAAFQKFETAVINYNKSGFSKSS